MKEDYSDRKMWLPEGVSSSDPVPELEHVLGVDAEVNNLGTVGGQRDEVLGHRGLLKNKWSKIEQIFL